MTNILEILIHKEKTHTPYVDGFILLKKGDVKTLWLAPNIPEGRDFASLMLAVRACLTRPMLNEWLGAVERIYERSYEGDMPLYDIGRARVFADGVIHLYAGSNDVGILPVIKDTDIPAQIFAI